MHTIRPFSLSFYDPGLEATYRHSTFRHIRYQGRAAMMIGIFVYLLCGVLDQWFVPAEVATDVWIVRFAALSVPFTVMILSVTPLFERYHSPLLAMVGLAAGSGLIGVMMLLPLESTPYYYPLMVGITFYTYNFIGTRFIYAFVVDLSLLAAYNLIFGMMMDYPLHVLIGHDIYIVAANLTGGVAGYLAERQGRMLFLREKELGTLNNSLEQTVAQKVEELRIKDQVLMRQSQMAAMGEMIGSIAHQLKQPLTVIGGNIENVVDAYEYNEINEEFMKTFQKMGRDQISYMVNTIDDFRHYFSPNKEKEDFSLPTLIDKTVKLLEWQLQGSGIRVETDVEEVFIHGLDRELQQVILNIANNAHDVLVEKRPENPTIRIRGYLSDRDSNVTVIIEDNGGGIPDEIAARIFDSYFTTKGEKGTGIGLSMSKMIIENSHGTIRVENGAEGARFIIRLPQTA